MQSIFFKKQILNTNWEVLEISGPDSRDFLHRLTTVSFKDFQFKEKQVTSGCLLQPNGKIISYFEALCIEKNRFWLVVAPLDLSSTDSASQNAFEIFEKMHFREDLKILPLGKKYIFYRLLFEKVPPLLPILSPQSLHFLEEEVVVFDLERDIALSNKSIHNWGLIVSSEKAAIWENHLQKSFFIKEENPDFIRIFNKEPEAGFEITSQVMPLEVGLEAAVQENKGCYPGQEVIERIRSMGKPPRILLRIKGFGKIPQRLEKISNEEDIAVGEITSVTATPKGSNYDWIALSLFKRVQYNENAKYFVNKNQITLD